MSQLTRQTTWASLQVLTAAALNAEFNNIINAWNGTDTGGTAWGALTVTANATVGGILGVTGNATVGGTLGVTGASTLTGNTGITGTLIVTGATTCNGKLVAKGTATNDSAAAGYIGEIISAGVSSANQVNAVNGQFKDITTIDLTAGDWSISGVVSFNLDAGSLSTNEMQGVISAYADNTATDHSNGVNLAYAVSSGGGVIYSVTIPPIRASLSGATTYHLKGLIGFSGGPPHLLGFINARRTR